jgi:preprotein translocase subunit SecD
LAADFVSILAAVVLYVLSVGSVRGFAFVLGLTTVIDIIVAFWFTHPLVVLMGRSEWMQKGSRWTGLSTNRLESAESSMPPSVAGARRREAKEGSQS